MKKISPVVIAIIVGSICAIYLYNKEFKGSVNKYNRVAIQVGAFKSLDSANSLRDNLGGIVIDDDGIYRVYVSILKNSDNINFFKDELDKKNISYYIKDIYLDDNKYLESIKYEELMEKTNNFKLKMKINNELLNYYKETL